MTLIEDKHLLMLNYKHQNKTYSYFQNSNTYLLQKKETNLSERRKYQIHSCPLSSYSKNTFVLTCETYFSYALDSTTKISGPQKSVINKEVHTNSFGVELKGF